MFLLFSSPRPSIAGNNLLANNTNGNNPQNPDLSLQAQLQQAQSQNQQLQLQNQYFSNRLQHSQQAQRQTVFQQLAQQQQFCNWLTQNFLAPINFAMQRSLYSQSPCEYLANNEAVQMVTAAICQFSNIQPQQYHLNAVCKFLAAEARDIANGQINHTFNIYDKNRNGSLDWGDIAIVISHASQNADGYLIHAIGGINAGYV